MTINERRRESYEGSVYGRVFIVSKGLAGEESSEAQYHLW